MKTIIIGGGFAGVKTALRLSKQKTGKITLISNEPYFLHHATLYGTATGRNMAESVIPLSLIFANHPNVTVVNDEMRSIDPSRKLVSGKNKDYEYDKLVIAIGSVTTFFNINGVASHAFGIKSLDEVKQFTDHLRDEIIKNKHLDKHYFVIGAGQTGVELAGALQEHLQYETRVNPGLRGKINISVVEAADRAVPRMSKTASYLVANRLNKIGVKLLLNHKVESLDGKTITIDHKVINTETAIWTSGVANHPFFSSHVSHFDIAPNGRVIVNQHLEANDNIYVIGDNNSVKYSGTSWPAMQQGAYVAKHIRAEFEGRLISGFRPRSQPSGIPIGENWGYVEWFGVYVSGRTGGFTRRLMELYGYCQILPFRTALSVWRAHDLPAIDMTNS